MRRAVWESIAHLIQGQQMPLRRPHKDETQADYMAYCMHELTESDKDKPPQERRAQDQKVAICLGSWRGDRAKAEADDHAMV